MAEYKRRFYGSEVYPVVHDENETLDELVNTEKSIARFGDGEMYLAFDGESLGFQPSSQELRNALVGIFENPSDDCLVCLPHSYFYITDGLRPSCETYITNVFQPKMKLGNYLGHVAEGKDYYDTNFGIYFHHYDRSQEVYEAHYERIRDVFRGKDVLLVTGDRGIWGYSHNIFDAAKSVEVVETPQKNAFSDYFRIRERILKSCKGKLVILICGPCATVLAYDLSTNYGVRALDMGHFAKDYNFWKSGLLPGYSADEPREFYTT